jgi:hypothetical protein
MDGERTDADAALARAREVEEQESLLDGVETPTTATLVEILRSAGYTTQRGPRGRVVFFDRDGDLVGHWLPTLVEQVRRERRDAARH